MAAGLLFDCDALVADTLFKAYRQPSFKYDTAIGILNDGQLVGVVLFHNWNGHNVEISYFGENTMTQGIIRTLAKYTIFNFNASRLTAIVSKKNKRFIKSLQKIGFRLEGIQRCHYGQRDINRNTGVRLVLFRAGLEQLATKNGTQETEVS